MAEKSREILLFHDQNMRSAPGALISKKDLKMIEKVQRRVTKFLPNIKLLNYQDRLSVYGLTDIKIRRILGFLIQMYKIIIKIEKVKLVNGVSVCGQGYNLRRFLRNLYREIVKNCPSRFYFLVNRVVNVWNELPEEVISACTINSFKSKLDVWMKTKTVSTAIAHQNSTWIYFRVTVLLLISKTILIFKFN